MSNNLFLKKARFVLYPVSLAYGAGVRFRHWLYDSKLLKSAKFNLPVICVGNLSLGGTGKSPMTEYLIRLLKTDYKVATLSRGYKRKTKGYAKANEHTTALEIGDEPMQFHEKFPDVVVAVAEERVVGIPQILYDHPETEVIILDDALQHRQVKAGFNILLTEYNNPFTDDHLFPAGNLRDVRSRGEAADIILVTKCPVGLSVESANKVTSELRQYSKAIIFFAALKYSEPRHLFTNEPAHLNNETDVLLLSGIANPEKLTEFLRETVGSYQMNQYRDHHIFTVDDLKTLKKDFNNIDSSNKIILTTEKDGVRLKKFRQEIGNLPVYVIPVEHHLLFEKQEEFNGLIIDFVRNFKEDE